jgi:hypothetical protein
MLSFDEVHKRTCNGAVTFVCMSVSHTLGDFADCMLVEVCLFVPIRCMSNQGPVANRIGVLDHDEEIIADC